MPKPITPEDTIDEIAAPADEAAIDEISADPAQPAAALSNDGIDEIPAEGGAPGEPVKDPGFFEKIRQSFIQRQQAEVEQAAVAEQIQAAIPKPEDDPQNWSAEEFKKRAPVPTNREDKAVYDAILKHKKLEEKGMAEKAYEAIFATPAAASREAIRGAAGAKPGERLKGAGAGYEKGAADPSASETFQDELIRKTNEGLDPKVAEALSSALGPVSGLLDPEHKETIGRFIAGTPASTLGLIADTITSPADLLLTILGEKALKYVGKIPIKGVSLAERAAAPIDEILASPETFRVRRGEYALPSDSPDLPAAAKPGVEIPGPEKSQAELDAIAKRERKGNVRKENLVNDLAEKIYNKEPLPPTDNLPPDFVKEAKERVIARIDQEAAEGVPGPGPANRAARSRYYRNREIRAKLKGELDQPALEKQYAEAEQNFTTEHGQPTPDEVAIADRVARPRAQEEFLREVTTGGELEGARAPSGGSEELGGRYAGNINLDRLQTSAEAEKVIQETASLYKTKITEQTRGKITHEETADLAKDLGMTSEKLLKLRKGRALNAEELLASRDILKDQTGKVLELQKKIAGGDNSDATLEEFRRQILAQANVQKAVSGATAESGRTLSALKVVAKEERIGRTAATLKVSRKMEAESLGSLIQKATKTLQNVKGSVGNLGPVDEEMIAAQKELLRRAKKAGAKSASETTDFLVKAGLTRETAEAMLKAAAQTVQTGSEFAQKKMTEALGDREITQEIAKKMASIDLSDPVAVNRFIRQTTKAKTADQVYFYFINSILSNPLTHIVNSTSNLARAVANPIYRAAGAAIESPKRLIGKKPEIYAGEAAQEIFGKLAGMKEGARRFLFTIKNGLTEEQVSKFDFRPVPIKGKAGDVVGAPTRALAAEDEFFKAMHEQGELRALAYREAKRQGKKGSEFWKTVHDLTEDPTPTMAEGATKAAERQTFQDPLGVAGNSYLKLRNKTFLKWITPFVKTPLNIAKESVRTSPAGFITAARKKGAERSMQMGQAAAGSAMAYYFAQTALEGRLTGGAPTGDAAKKRFFAEGKKPYAIKIGSKWIEYRRIEPFATPIGLIADGHRLWKEKDLQDAGIGEIAAEAGRLLGKNAVDKTFMQGLGNLVNAIDDPGRYGEKFLASYASGMIFPAGALRSAANATDDTVRDPKGFVETIKAGLPWASKTVRPKLDPFGEPAKKTGSVVERTLSPMQSSKESEDPIVKELSRLDITIPSSGKKQGGVKLTEDEYFSFMQGRGKNIRTRLERIMNAPNYQYLEDDRKKRIMEKYVNSDKPAPKDVKKTAGARVYDEISTKLDTMGTNNERADYIVRLLEKKKISTKIARRLRRDFLIKKGGS